MLLLLVDAGQGAGAQYCRWHWCGSDGVVHEQTVRVITVWWWWSGGGVSDGT